MELKSVQHSRFHFSKRELIDLTKAWIAIAIAFAIVLSPTLFSTQFFATLLIAAVTAGFGFLLHELAHKYVAQQYGCQAEFKSSDGLLLLSIFIATFGVLFAAPGAVYISGYVTTRVNGKISVAGPLMNILLAVVFFFLQYIPIAGAPTVGSLGVMINAWLAIFNMIPFMIFDGAKVWKWNKGVWLAVVVAGGVLLGLNVWLG